MGPDHQKSIPRKMGDQGRGENGVAHPKDDLDDL